MKKSSALVAALCGCIACGILGTSAASAAPVTVDTPTVQASTQAPAFDMVGDTILNLKNSSSETIEVHAYLNGDSSKQLFYICTLKPGESHRFQGHNAGIDNNLIIKSKGNDSEMEPRLRLAATNPTVGTATVATFRDGAPVSNENIRTGDSMSGTDRDKKTVRTHQNGDLKYTQQRDNDVDSGHWYQASHCQFNVDLIWIPVNKYDVTKDPKTGGGGAPTLGATEGQQATR